MKKVLRWFLKKYQHKLLPLVFEATPLKVLSGHKTKIGRALMAGSALIWVLNQHYPELPYLAQAHEQLVYLLSSGWVATELGLQHKKSKLERE